MLRDMVVEDPDGRCFLTAEAAIAFMTAGVDELLSSFQIPPRLLPRMDSETDSVEIVLRIDQHSHHMTLRPGREE